MTSVLGIKKSFYLNVHSYVIFYTRINKHSNKRTKLPILCSKKTNVFLSCKLKPEIKNSQILAIIKNIMLKKTRYIVFYLGYF